MASIKPHNGNWRAFVFKLGIRATKVFKTKAQAQAWAATTEAGILAGKGKHSPGNKTFADLLTEYATKVSPTKRGHHWEQIRIELFKRDEIAKVRLAELDAPHFAQWRDRRLQSVSAATVRREWVLMSGACTVAMNEWKWLSHHPMKGVKRPAAPASRDRLLSTHERAMLRHAFGTSWDKIIGRTYHAFMFACETAMRAGEIAGLEKDLVFLDRDFCTVKGGKTDAATRDVPLSPEAAAILREAMAASETDSVFNLTPQQIDAHFRKGRARSGITGLHFHDSRHVGITKLAQKLEILELARSVGIRDLKALMVYYNETAEDIAKKLR